MSKTIIINIPENETIPEIISTFSLEENFLMLKIGSECLREGRNAVANLSQKELYNKIKEESKEEVKKFELEILVQREMSKQMEEKIAKIYDGQVEQLKKQLESLRDQLKSYEIENKKKEESIKDEVKNEVDKMKEKYNLLLQEKDRQNQLNREVFDIAAKLVSKNLNKSSSIIGDDGEQIFEYLSDEAFKDFQGYRIENKTKQAHKGDFHLFFDEFKVLIDSKNYSSNVQKKEITKIEADLNMNNNMDFAWMVSLNTNICEHNKFPISMKWVTTDIGIKCILFINNLLDNKEPKNILRQAWSICNEISKLTKKNGNFDDKNEELKYKERDSFLKKHIENLQENINQIKRNINISLNIIKQLDNDLLEMLSIVSNEIIKNNFETRDKIIEWWDSNIETISDECTLTSTEIWAKFKKNNKSYVLDNKITIEIFKDIITGIVNHSSYIEKSKNSVIEFVGFKFKNIIIKEPENVIIKISKKIKTEKMPEFYFDEIQDNKILEEYNDNNNDIIEISSINNICPWQVVSLLMRHKKIKKRDEARGYDKYKLTEEYKNKIEKK